MMNIRNLSSSESVVVTFKEGTCTDLRLKLWFETDGIFVILLSQDSFESDCPKRKS